MGFTSAALAHAEAQYERLNARIKNMSEEEKRKASYVAEMVEVPGVAALLAWANGRWGTNGALQVFGVPIDAIVGFGAATAGVLGVGKQSKSSEIIEQQLVHVGTGAMACFLGRTAYQMGADAAARAAQAQPQNASPTSLPAARAMNGLNPPSHATAGWDGQTYTVHEHY